MVEESDMKIKCKKCNKKCKLRSPKDVDCIRSDCDIKFNMTDLILEFGPYEEEKMQDVTTITDFVSPEPTAATTNPAMTDAGWQEWISNNIGVPDYRGPRTHRGYPDYND
jgi:hypothetical protein